MADPRDDVIGRVLQTARKTFAAQTGDDDLWSFTIDAVIFLTEWLGLSEPHLAHNFLLAMARRAAATTRPQMDEANHVLVATRKAPDAGIGL